MSDNRSVEIDKNALDVVDSWLGATSPTEEEVKQPVFEKRAQRLGLGAKFVPHKKVLLPSLPNMQQQDVPSVLKKKILREKRRKREQKLEERDVSSDSDSEEENMSKARLLKSKVNHESMLCLLFLLYSGKSSQAES